MCIVSLCTPYHAARQTQIEGDSKFYGSGSIVTCGGKFYLLTCCHNFLKKGDGDSLQNLKTEYVEREMKGKCKRAKYFFSSRDFKSTVALRADVVLTNREDPDLVFDQVGHSWHPSGVDGFLQTLSFLRLAWFSDLACFLCCDCLCL